MDKLFIQLYHFIAKWKKSFFAVFTLFIATCIFFATQINFDEDITKILPKGEKSSQVAKVINQLNFSDKITVMIEAKEDSTKNNLAEIASQFIDSIAVDSLYYTDIQGQVDNQQIDETFNFVYEHLPLFLEEADYLNIKNKIQKDSIDKSMLNNYKTLISPTGIVARDFILKDPLGFSFIGLNKLRAQGVSEDFIINDGFVATQDSATLLLFISPRFSGTDSKANAQFVENLYRYQENINAANDGIAELTYFGAPFIALANAEQIKSDIKGTVVISITLLMLILILFYRRLQIPIILFIPALSGAATAIAILYFINPSISAISISIGAILLGVTLDYSIHVVTHFREHADIETMYKNVTKPLLGCSITTAIAFLCLLFVKSKVLQDLGVFAAISIISAAIFALLIIPHIYKPKGTPKTNLIDRLGAHQFEKNYWLIGLTSIAIIFSVFTFSKVKFNNNIADLNFVPQNMKKAEKQLEDIGSLGAKSIYLTTYGNDLEALLNKNTELEEQLSNLKAEHAISDYNSIGQLVLSQKYQKEKIDRWNKFWSEGKITQTIQNVEDAARELGFNADAFESLSMQLTKKYPTITLDDYEQLAALPIKEFLIEKDGFITLSTIVKTDSLNYQHAVDKLEQENTLVIDRKHINEEFLGQMRDDFKSLMNYSLIAVFLILLVFFRNILLALLGIIPIVLTGIVTMGFVYLLQLELNIFSTIVTTLILGIGVDFSIFMTSGLQKRYTTGKNELNTYRTSIILAVLTTLLSIGALVFAKHPALKSISWVSLIGITAAMLITFVFYPLIFKLVIGLRPSKGKSPVTIRLFISAVLSHFYFAAGSLFLSFCGWLFMFIPYNKEKKQKKLRKAIAKFVKSVYYSNYGVKNRLKNPHNETFDKPAIIIANHASFLDTLSIGFIPTDFTFIVNDWVYNSAIFGKAIRSAGYYPTTKGLENGEQQLIEMIKKGSSLVVFPEGTRSLNGSISRFKKGAFFLAQKYDIDIVPLYIHGNFNIVPKGDFIIYDGNHTLEIGERIKITDALKELSTRDLTKKISQLFQEKFQSIRDKEEGIRYFQQKIELNFLYKTQEVIAQAKREFETNKQAYHVLNSFLHERESIARIGNDLGIWDLMLLLQQGNRKVNTFLLEEHNRNVAKQSYLIHKRKLNYVDQWENLSGETLLITCSAPTSILNELIEQQHFKKIILLNNTLNPEYFTTFGWTIEVNNCSFSILKA